MTKPKKPKGPTKAQLQRKIAELEAQMAFTYPIASSDIRTCHTQRFMGGGILVHISALGSANPIVQPFVVRDGFSEDTIKALQDDINRSYNLAITIEPGG
jgi:hypothetical protein